MPYICDKANIEYEMKVVFEIIQYFSMFSLEVDIPEL